MKNICVFCGSGSGITSDYTKMAHDLGAELTKRNMGLVYGGASIGVMGAVAEGCLSSGGKVYGVIPQSIKDLEVGHEGLTQLEVVDTMHDRKARMYDLSDAFFALPGGMGTLDELCEIVTWAQLQYHTKPCYVINYNGFFDALMQHFKFINQQGFLSDDHLKLVREFPDFASALNDFESLK